jgi:tetratricopeptide (TPR) repeat protein
MAFVHAVTLYQRGQVDSARAFAAQLDTASNPFDRSQAIDFVGQIDESAGKLKQAYAELTRGNAIDRQRGAFSPVLADSGQKAFFDAWFRDKGADAVRTLDAALAAEPMRMWPVDQRPYAQVATVYAVAGRADKARALLAEAEAAYAGNAALRSAMRPALSRAMGYAQLAENKPREALKSFWASDSLADGPADDCAACTAFVVGLAYDRANQPDSAIAEYQRFLTTPGGPTGQRNGDNLALAYKSLGRLYEDKGDRGNAATYYSKFVDLWKNADADLQPQVADVKKRLAHLKDTEGRP